MNYLVRATLALSFVAGSLAVPVPAALGRGENAEPGATNTLFVNGTTGSDGNSCQTSTAACRTIGAAVSKSRGQGTISIASGTYAENLVLDNVNLAIVGAGSGTTAIDGGGNGRVVNWAPSTLGGSNLSLSNITIQNGLSQDGTGAGMYVNGDASLTLSGVVFNQNGNLNSNLATGFGGGLYFDGVQLTATDVTFSRNSANFGSGLFFTSRNFGKPSTLMRVMFTGNLGGTGGGLYVLNVPETTLTLTDVVFDGTNQGIVGDQIALCFAGVSLSSGVSILGGVSVDFAQYGGPCNQYRGQ